MLFRLIVLLAAGLFIAMYFAPDRPGVARAPSLPRVAAPGASPAKPPAAPPAAESRNETAAGTALPPPPVAQTDVEPAQTPLAEPGAPSGTLAGAQGAGGEAATAAGAEAAPGGEQADPFAAATEGAGPPAGTPLPDLGQLGVSGNAGAVSLSDSVRSRTAPEAVPAPPTRPGLLGSPGAPGAAGATVQAPGQAPAQPAVGPVSGPRAQVVATSVNLRAGPSTGTPVLGRVSFGDVVVIVLPNAAPGWTGIRDPRTGQTAFISSQFLQVIP